MIEDSPTSYKSSIYSDPSGSSFRTSAAFSTPSTSSYFNNDSSNISGGSSSNGLRQSLSSSRLNNNSSSNSNKYGRLSRHFSFDNDANDATLSPTSSTSYMSPETYVTLTRLRRNADQPSAVEKYFSPTTTTPSAATPLSRQSSSSSTFGAASSSYQPRPSTSFLTTSKLSTRASVEKDY